MNRNKFINTDKIKAPELDNLNWELIPQTGVNPYPRNTYRAEVLGGRVYLEVGGRGQTWTGELKINSGKVDMTLSKIEACTTKEDAQAHTKQMIYNFFYGIQEYL